MPVYNVHVAPFVYICRIKFIFAKAVKDTVSSMQSSTQEKRLQVKLSPTREGGELTKSSLNTVQYTVIMVSLNHDNKLLHTATMYIYTSSTAKCRGSRSLQNFVAISQRQY